MEFLVHIDAGGQRRSLLETIEACAELIFPVQRPPILGVTVRITVPLADSVEGHGYIAAYSSQSSFASSQHADLVPVAVRTRDLCTAWPSPRLWLVVDPGLRSQRQLRGTDIRSAMLVTDDLSGRRGMIIECAPPER